MNTPIRLVFLGRLADVAGGAASDWPGEAPLSIEAICAAQAPPLATALADPRVRFAINGTLAPREALLRAGDELACLPPVSGG